jgi:hypothetical protein
MKAHVQITLQQRQAAEHVRSLSEPRGVHL